MTDLTLLNKWWKGKECLEQDKHLVDFKEKRYQWQPRLLKEIVLAPDNIFTLLGPRQVGKTTLIKLLIKSLLAKVDEKAVFFWNCDELVDFRELSLILKEYLSLAESYQLKEKFIFLDEISRVKNWQRAIKFLADAGALKECCVFLTGSHTLDLKYGMDRLPGRTGKLGKTLILLPLSFSEFVNLVAPEIFCKISPVRDFTVAEVNKSIAATKLFESELKVLFENYLITGGFPLVINEFLTNKKIPDYVLEVYHKWIVGDVVKWGKQEKILIQLLKSLIVKQSSALSWDSLSKEAEIKSHKTVSSYIEVLENMFAVKVLHFLELDKKILNYAKNKKLYFSDPFIYHVFGQKIYFKEFEITPALIEAVVVSHLSRFGETSYWKNKREVDVLLKVKEELFPCEVKYQHRISPQDYAGLHHFQKGILVTRDYLNLGEKYSAVPVHLFLASLP